MADGRKYEGMFKDGMMHGEGVMISQSGKQMRGYWNNNTFVRNIMLRCSE